MTLVLSDRRLLNHRTGHHPEQPARLQSIWGRLDLSDEQYSSAELADDSVIRSVHKPDYVEKMEEFAAQGGGNWDADTVVCTESFNIAKLAAGMAMKAVDEVVANETENALCLVRPPGHHAVADRAMGFCLLNNVAIAARYALDRYQMDRILIVDWDVHHGNGTQDIFYESGKVYFFSSHRHPFYPGTGTSDETGTGPGLGATCNLPFPFGIQRRSFLDSFQTELTEFARKCKPDLVLISAGFDAHHRDPVGSLGLETEDFAELTEIVMQVAEGYCNGKIVSLLEGGYHLDALAESVEVHLKTLQKKPSSDPGRSFSTHVRYWFCGESG